MKKARKVSIEELIEVLDQVEFLKAIIRVYVVTGEGQMESLYQDWKKKQGVFRPNRLG